MTQIFYFIVWRSEAQNNFDQVKVKVSARLVPSEGSSGRTLSVAFSASYGHLYPLAVAPSSTFRAHRSSRCFCHCHQ